MEELKLRVCTHEVELPGRTIGCRTWLSEGLASVGQCEVALTYRCDGDDDEGDAEDLDRYFRSLQAWASNGEIVSEGGFTKMAEPLLGRRGIIYTEACGLEHLRLPPNELRLTLRLQPDGSATATVEEVKGVGA